MLFFADTCSNLPLLKVVSTLHLCALLEQQLSLSSRIGCISAFWWKCFNLPLAACCLHVCRVYTYIYIVLYYLYAALLFGIQSTPKYNFTLITALELCEEVSRWPSRTAKRAYIYCNMQPVHARKLLPRTRKPVTLRNYGARK